jgi:hypothetical protein
MYLGFIVAGPSLYRIVVRTGLFSVMVIFAWSYFSIEMHYIGQKRAVMMATERDVFSEMPAALVAKRHILNLFFTDTPEVRGLLETGIEQLRAAKFKDGRLERD